MEFSFPIMASSILIPAILSPIIYLAGRSLKERTGWLAFLILLYPLSVASYILLNGSSASEPLYFNTSTDSYILHALHEASHRRI